MWPSHKVIGYRVPGDPGSNAVPLVGDLGPGVSGCGAGGPGASVGLLISVAIAPEREGFLGVVSAC